MPPETSEQLIETLLQLHRENKAEWGKISTLLLDFNERLVITEQSGKYAEQFRLLLLQEITKVGDKVDKLHDLPGKVEQLSQQFTALSATVRTHDQIVTQFQGGWVLAKFLWLGAAALVGFLSSYITTRITTGH